MPEEPEEWRPVVGYDGLYEVSSLGRVRSIDRRISAVSKAGRLFSMQRRGVVLAQARRGDYLGVILCREGRTKSFNVHRLVCAAFNGPGPNGSAAAHFDGDRTNNRAANLRWATYVENSADTARLGRLYQGEVHFNAKLSVEDVAAIRASRERVAVLADRFDVCRGTIYSVQRRKHWKHV